MLEHKGIAYKRTDLLPVISKGALRGARLPAQHGAGAEDRRRARCRARAQIARELERLRPEPPLFPADPEQRAAVEEAERFGDEELQHPIRQILWWAIKQRQGAAAQLLGGRQARRPDRPGDEDRRRRSSPSRPASTKPTTRTSARDLAALPGLLDRVDAWIAAGVLERRASSTPPTSRSPPASAWR